MVVAGTYDPYLVALSIVVAALASYTALDLGGRVAAARGLGRRSVWLAAAAITMGGGIWSMHFVAMLAFIMPTPMSYDIGLTALSLVVAIFVTGGGFYVLSRHSGSPLRLVRRSHAPRRNAPKYIRPACPAIGRDRRSGSVRIPGGAPCRYTCHAGSANGARGA